MNLINNVHSWKVHMKKENNTVHQLLDITLIKLNKKNLKNLDTFDC